MTVKNHRVRLLDSGKREYLWRATNRWHGLRVQRSLWLTEDGATDESIDRVFDALRAPMTQALKDAIVRTGRDVV